jgi:hypothetical protein
MKRTVEPDEDLFLGRVGDVAMPTIILPLPSIEDYRRLLLLVIISNRSDE